MARLKHAVSRRVKHSLRSAVDNSDAMNIGDRIKTRRTELGLTVVCVAKYVGVTVQSVYQWESGDTKGLKPANLVAVAECLKTTEKWLATGKEPKSRPLTDRALSPVEQELLEHFGKLQDDGKSAVMAISRQLAAQHKGEKGK